MRRTVRLVSPVAAGLLLVAGCSSDDPEELSLDPSNGVNEPGDDAEDEPTDPDDDPTEAPDDQLYPPLPDLEPDPDSDLDDDEQLALLAVHQTQYAVTQEALATNDGTRLPDVLADELLAQMEHALEAQAELNVVSRAPDARITWVRVTDAGGGPFTVEHCRETGASTGFYDFDSGALVEGGEPGSARVVTNYEIVEIDGALDYRAVSSDGAAVESCDA